ncbi:hypothetical protein ACFV5G_36010 [Streptomyces sp. NPDC059766]|uniref:hypothetical protein n=1 Tax=Streptomyces sp. NPDC059766 TaxID=3346940 RepID=UPI003648DD6E
MPEHLSIPQLAGVAVLALAAAVVWVMCLTRVLRRGPGGGRYGASGWRSGRRADLAAFPVLPAPSVLSALPAQRQAGPQLESVELTPAEEDAFAGLVRRFGAGG